MKMTALINVAKTPGDGIDAPTHQHMRKKIKTKDFNHLTRIKQLRIQ